MLRLSKAPLNAAQVRSYHERDFVNSEQRYYSQDNTVRGEWQGKLVVAWGLAEAVRDDQFYRLAEGQHPITGEHLVLHRRAEYESRDGKNCYRHRCIDMGTPKSNDFLQYRRVDHGREKPCPST